MGTLNTLIEWLFTFVAGFFGNVIANDFCEAAPMTSRKLIEFAAARLPETIRDRYLEEWRADLQAQPGAIAKVLWALGCLKSVYRLRREYRLDFLHRLSIEIVLPGGEVIEANAATVTLAKNLALALLFRFRWRVPKKIVATLAGPLILHVAMPIVAWRLKQQGDVFKAVKVVEAAPYGWKVITRLDGAILDEEEFAGVRRPEKQ